MGIQFHETIMGQRFFNGTLPKLCDAIEALAAELKRANDLKEMEIQKAKESIPLFSDDLPFEIEIVSPFYTGGGVYLFVGSVSQNGNSYYFTADESNNLVSIIDSSPYYLSKEQYDLIFDPDWLRIHELSDNITDAGWFIDQLILHVLENEPVNTWCNYNMADMEQIAERRKLNIKEEK